MKNIQYPSPSTEPGAPFADPNFKLAVMSTLVSRKDIELGEVRDFVNHFMKREVDLEDEGYELFQECYDYLVRYPLTPELLAKVDKIVLDGGNDIYRYAFYFWGGDTEDFDITSLKGIEHCPNLHKLDIISMTPEVDCGEIARAQSLEIVDLLPADMKNFEALLKLPKLKELIGFFRNATPAEIKVFEQLRARGVKIKSNNGDPTL